MKLYDDIVCMSHLRWNFVFQRPQHLLTRAAKNHRVFFIEEPIYEEATNCLRVHKHDYGVTTITPVLSSNLDREKQQFIRRALLTNFINTEKITDYISWYYTPIALNWLMQDEAKLCVYDCMDELSHFKGAPAELKEKEKRLFKKADLVFTGGYSLYEFKKTQHPRVYPFPSSVDVPHFAKARTLQADEAADQANIPHPRLGFFGVVDERFDTELLAAVADLKPEYQFVIIGPVVKISEEDLPRRKNIHYLGQKSYSELPRYLAGWEVALMPFAKNDATKFISPTKTPEYLAAGRPVVSTSITDVVHPYGKEGLVYIADEPELFAAYCQKALEIDKQALLKQVDQFLSDKSWDLTWDAMEHLINDALLLKEQKLAGLKAPAESYSPAELFDRG